MEKVALRFARSYDLWEFRTTISTKKVFIEFTTLTLYCECCQEEIDLAITKFDAKVVETGFLENQSSSTGMQDLKFSE